MAVASLTAFRYHPEAFFAWIHPLAAHILESQPNAAHAALARLEAAGRLKGVVTQNIDGLHGRAGSRRLFEIHGHLRQATCIACYCTFDTDAMLAAFSQSGAVPRCGACGGVLKPNVVLFGEQLPQEDRARRRGPARTQRSAAHRRIVVGSDPGGAAAPAARCGPAPA